MKRTRIVSVKTREPVKKLRHSVSKYLPEYAKMGYEIALLCRASEKDLSRIFDVSPATIQNWKKENPDFAREIDRGKDKTDARVVATLVERCFGYNHPETKVTNYQGVVTQTVVTKHIPPDITGIKFWLTNRQKEHWTETTRVENQTDVHLHRDVSLKDISTEELVLMKKLSMRKLLQDQSKKN